MFLFFSLCPKSKIKKIPISLALSFLEDESAVAGGTNFPAHRVGKHFAAQESASRFLEFDF
jgi:hypothetical protein